MSDLTTEISILIDNKTVIAKGRLTSGCIHDLDVKPEYRRRGIATDIIEKLVDIGGKYLWVEKKNTAAINLYKKCGFIVSEEDAGYYKMERSL